MLTETRTARDLTVHSVYDKPIKADGRKLEQPYFYSKSQWSVNTSSILTKLIQEAGRYCEAYASDLFIDWQTVEEMLSGEREFNTMFFGFRENGVDGESFINSRMQNDPWCKEYRSIWRLDIEIAEDNSGYFKSEDIEMVLYRVS